MLIGAVSGAAAGFATDVFCYPIEAIKTRLQSGPSHQPDKDSHSHQNLSIMQKFMSLLVGLEVEIPDLLQSTF